MNWKDIQNNDGGWGYGRGCSECRSWTEPTVFALLAQSVSGVDRQSFAAGVKFLYSMRRPDGGWSPQPGVSESTWVTSLIALLPPAAVDPKAQKDAIHWLRGQTGRESGWSFRIRQRIAGSKDEYPEGMPWFPGAAAWVIPTSLSILAFERALKTEEDRQLRQRVEEGRRFLFTHMCADGGWNHGSNRALGRDGESYPETTGIALTALHGAREKEVGRAREAARKHYTACRTAEGTSWLRLGLAAQGERVVPPANPVMRTTLDQALYEIASSGRNPLLS